MIRVLGSCPENEDIVITSVRCFLGSTNAIEVVVGHDRRMQGVVELL